MKSRTNFLQAPVDSGTMYTIVPNVPEDIKMVTATCIVKSAEGTTYQLAKVIRILFSQ